LYDSLCEELAVALSENLEDTGDLKHKIEVFVRSNKSLSRLSTIEKISLAQSWLWRIQGYDFLDPYLKDP
jgi:hypothetical protein